MAQVGDKIRMDGERQRYTIRAIGERYVILTKPMNALKTYLYTIIDFERSVRGPCNLIFGLPCHVNTVEGANEAMEMLNKGEMDVSYRRQLPLCPSEIAQFK